MICPECFQPIDGMCYECGAFFETQDLRVYDLQNYTPKFKRLYCRLDHFKEVLNQLQGKEGRVITPDIIHKIKNELENKPMTIKQALRELKMTKYVENANYLDHIINNKILLYIPKLVEEKMIRFFKQIDRTFDALFGNRKQSFMSYNYVIYKLLECMHENDLMKEIPLLKTRSRLRQHDKVWWAICEELDWQFISTI